MATQSRRTRTSRTSRPFRWTSAWLARLPDDGNRYEVLDGALLVTPQARYRHQNVALELATILRSWCGAHQIGTVVAPGSVQWKRNELQPDVEVIPRTFNPGDDPEWKDLPLPLLVVEVLSPGSARHDRYRKRDAYLALGIPEYWIVDVEARMVTVCRPGEVEAVVLTRAMAWQPRTDIPALPIDLTKLFGGA